MDLSCKTGNRDVKSHDDVKRIDQEDKNSTKRSATGNEVCQIMRTPKNSPCAKTKTGDKGTDDMGKAFEPSQAKSSCIILHQGNRVHSGPLEGNGTNQCTKSDGSVVHAIHETMSTDQSENCCSVETEDDDVESWTLGQHRSFVAIVLQQGIKHSSPSVILEYMRNVPQAIGRETVKSHLQKYRSSSKQNVDDFMRDYDDFFFTADKILETEQNQNPKFSDYVAILNKASQGREPDELLGGAAAAYATYAVKHNCPAKPEIEEVVYQGIEAEYPVLTEDEEESRLGRALMQVKGALEFVKEFVLKTRHSIPMKHDDKLPPFLKPKDLEEAGISLSALGGRHSITNWVEKNVSSMNFPPQRLQHEGHNTFSPNYRYLASAGSSHKGPTEMDSSGANHFGYFAMHSLPVPQHNWNYFVPPVAGIFPSNAGYYAYYHTEPFSESCECDPRTSPMDEYNPHHEITSTQRQARFVVPCYDKFKKKDQVPSLLDDCRLPSTESRTSGGARRRPTPKESWVSNPTYSRNRVAMPALALPVSPIERRSSSKETSRRPPKRKHCHSSSSVWRTG